MVLWLRARTVLKASWELAALTEDQLPLTFQESFVLFFNYGKSGHIYLWIVLEKIGFGGSGQDHALPVVNLLFSSIVSLIPVGTILKVRTAKGSF